MLCPLLEFNVDVSKVGINKGVEDAVVRRPDDFGRGFSREPPFYLATVLHFAGKAKDSRFGARAAGPFAPMSRFNDDWFAGLSVDQSVLSPAAGEDQWMRAALWIDDSEFEIAIKRRGGDGLPFHKECC